MPSSRGQSGTLSSVYPRSHCKLEWLSFGFHEASDPAPHSPWSVWVSREWKWLTGQERRVGSEGVGMMLAAVSLAFSIPGNSAASHFCGDTGRAPFHILAFPAPYFVYPPQRSSTRRGTHRPGHDIPEPIRSEVYIFLRGEMIHAIAHADN